MAKDTKLQKRDITLSYRSQSDIDKEEQGSMNGWSGGDGSV